jgi:hypothetical protein
VSAWSGPKRAMAAQAAADGVDEVVAVGEDDLGGRA